MLLSINSTLKLAASLCESWCLAIMGMDCSFIDSDCATVSQTKRDNQPNDRIAAYLSGSKPNHKERNCFGTSLSIIRTQLNRICGRCRIESLYRE